MLFARNKRKKKLMKRIHDRGFWLAIHTRSSSLMFLFCIQCISVRISQMIEEARPWLVTRERRRRRSGVNLPPVGVLLLLL